MVSLPGSEYGRLQFRVQHDGALSENNNEQCSFSKYTHSAYNTHRDLVKSTSSRLVQPPCPDARTGIRVYTNNHHVVKVDFCLL